MVFPSILKLYAKEQDLILDLTWGRGVFWKRVEMEKYNVVANDQFSENARVDTHYDFRSTHFLDGYFDMVVFDPPYMPNSGTIGGNSTVKSVADAYRNNDSTPLKNQKEVVALYQDGVAEATRILKARGYLVVKCKDMTGSGREGWIHDKIMNTPGFRCEDLFVVIMSGNQLFDPKWKNQHHSRKNNSYFVVLRKEK